MKTLEIQVPDDVASKIERAAEEKGVSLDELVRLSLEEKLARDEQFEDAARLVLAKNAELYERLS
jgi:glutamyl-tRNA reductase